MFRWIFSEKPKYCKGCVELQRCTKQRFNCNECEYNSPKPCEGVKVAFKAFEITRMQRRYHMSGLAGFDMPAVLQVVKEYGIRVSPQLIEHLNTIEGLELEEVRKYGK